MILYGSDQSDPSADACEQLTQEFFREDTYRLLIVNLPKLSLGVIVIVIMFDVDLFVRMVCSESCF